ncbi:MAG: hypothetical protein Kow0074_09680 [Candidatus Zixiibacteriota bacterium]
MGTLLVQARIVPPAIACTVALLIFALAEMVFAQQPSVRPYESEEDLWEALREGEIRQDEYDELLEILRLGTDSTFVPESDWETLPGSDAGYLSPPDSSSDIARADNFIATAWRDIQMRWRSGFEGRLSSPTQNDAYTNGRIESPNWRVLLSWRSDERGARWQRRVIEARSHGFTLQAGNVEPRWGRGLVIGRRSRLLGSRIANRPDGGFLQPDQSRLNGLWLRSDASRTLSAHLLVSDIRSDSLIERMIGAQVVARRGIVRVGVATLTGGIEKPSSAAQFRQNIIGGHVQVGNDHRAVLGEIATERNGATAKAAELVWGFERGRFHGTAWSYSDGFVNPWGGGPSHSDRTSITLDAIDESYSTRTTGERGFALSTRLNARPLLGGSAAAHWNWMTHRETASTPLAHTWTVSLIWRRADFRIRPYARGESTEGKDERFALGFYSYAGPSDRRMSLRFEAGRHRVAEDRYVRTGAGIDWRLNDHVVLEPAIRWVDPNLDEPGDGYWYLYFTEQITPADSWRIEAALVWQRYEQRANGDLAELRVRGVVGL